MALSQFPSCSRLLGCHIRRLLGPAHCQMVEDCGIGLEVRTVPHGHGGVLLTENPEDVGLGSGRDTLLENGRLLLDDHIASHRLEAVAGQMPRSTLRKPHHFQER